MRKLLAFFTAILFFVSSFASSTPSAPKVPVLRADEMFFPVGKTGEMISLLELSRISVKDLQKTDGTEA